MSNGSLEDGVPMTNQWESERENLHSLTCRALHGGGRWGRGRLRQGQPSRDTEKEVRLDWG